MRFAILRRTFTLTSVRVKDSVSGAIRRASRALARAFITIQNLGFGANHKTARALAGHRIGDEWPIANDFLGASTAASVRIPNQGLSALENLRT